MDRRDFLRLALVSGAAGAFGLAGAQPRMPGPRAVARFMFLTDIHLPAEGKNEQAAQAVRQMEQRFGHHDFVVFGGDNLMAVENATTSSAQAQYLNWTRFVNRTFSQRTYTVLGNHDIHGWKNGSESGMAEKRDAAALFGMPDRYYAFEREGWRFLMLDSVQKDDKLGYIARIDDAQMEWLKKELPRSALPTTVVSHVPILAASNLASSEAVRTRTSTKVAHQRVVANSPEVLELFRQHPNVRLCLSGHLHMVDSVRFRHTKFLCAGALSGNWWQGEHEHFGAIGWSVTLFADGKSRALPMEFGSRSVLVS